MTNASDSSINGSIGSAGFNFKGKGTIQGFTGNTSILNILGGYVGDSWKYGVNIQAGQSDGVTGIAVTDVNAGSYSSVRASGITTPTLTQTSKEENKKNFEVLNNGLEIIKNTDIYKYNLKSQKDTDKKHIGFVIGDSYNYSKEITSENNDGVDTYSMISVAYKAIQELAAQNEQLQNEIKELKGEK